MPGNLAAVFKECVVLQDLMGIVRVELNESHQSVGAIGLLIGEEAVETSDDVGGHGLHGARAVENEVDVEIGRGHTFLCLLAEDLVVFVALSPRSRTRRIVSLIPSASAFPTSARRCRRSSGRRMLMRRLDERCPSLELLAK